MNGNRATPLITEEYRPTDGQSFSVTCDYFHSTWIDLFMKYWAGIHIKEDGIDFSPFTDEEFTLTNVHIGGKQYTFSQRETSEELVHKFEEVK